MIKIGLSKYVFTLCISQKPPPGGGHRNMYPGWLTESVWVLAFHTQHSAKKEHNGNRKERLIQYTNKWLWLWVPAFPEHMLCSFILSEGAYCWKAVEPWASLEFWEWLPGSIETLCSSMRSSREQMICLTPEFYPAPWIKEVVGGASHPFLHHVFPFPWYS